MSALVRFTVAATLFLVSAAPAHAWNATGHRASAAVAWEGMSRPARAEATRLLKAHPNYERDLLAELPQGYDTDKWAFMSAAVWPDVLRDNKHPQHDLHRGPWHYVNYAYAPDGNTRNFPAPAEAWRPGEEPQNVIGAIKKALHDVADPRQSDAERAVALAWYLHLVGDVHQPLHSVALVSERFPNGDRGGNLVGLMVGGTRTNLHAYWDGRLGRYSAGNLLDRVVDRVLNDTPVRALGPAAVPAEPEAYAHESLELARLWVYLGGTFPSPKPGAELDTPPTGYDVVSAAIARRRLAQAGYRMATQLDDLLARTGR